MIMDVDDDELSEDFMQPKVNNAENIAKKRQPAARNSESFSKSQSSQRGTFSCQFCKAPFSFKSNCTRHEKHCNANEQKVSGKFLCVHCKAVFTRRDHLSAHSKVCNSLKVKPHQVKSQNPCLIKDCTASFFHKTSLIQHLSTAHQDCVAIKPSVKRTFSSIKEFNLWKEKEEERTFSYFTARKGQAKSANKYFYCQHDGPAKVHSARKTSRANRKGRVKVGHHCIAKMTVRVDDTKKVHLEYDPTHSHVCKREDMLHHPLPEAMSRFIDEHLAKKIPPTVVYDLTKEQFLPKNNTNVHDTRASILTKKRILERGRRRRMALRLHKDDAKAVYLLASQLIEKGDVLIYKPFGSAVVHGPKEINELPNSKELFMFGFQTERQLELMRRHCSKIMLVDETHGTNQYRYQLLTAMVVDENRRGWPVGHLITSKSDASTLQYFFQCLSSRLGQEAEVNCVITDDDQALINAMEQGFSKKLKHLLCKWHVLKNLKENIRTKAPSDLFDSMMTEVKVIMNAEDEKRFLMLKAGFLEKYESNDNASKVLMYLEKHYWKRAEKWAACYRNFPHAEVNTTGHIESFHNRLKKFYLKRKVNKRLDDLINQLYDLEWDDHRARLREASIGFSAQPGDILKNHKLGLLMEDDAIIEQALDRMWEVKSASGKSCTYIVERYKETCHSDFCFCKCKQVECHGLCAHIFSCSCPNHHPLCKHIHKVQSFLTRGQAFFPVEDDDFYVFGNSKKPEELNIEYSDEPNGHVDSSHERKTQVTVERLQSNISFLQQFLSENKIPEHILTRMDCIISDFVKDIQPSEVPETVEELVPAVSYAPNEKLKTQISQLAAFRRPPKRKRLDHPSILAAKNKAAVESLLSCLPENKDLVINTEDANNSLWFFTPPSSYVSDPFDYVLHCGGEDIAFIQLKSLELELPNDEELIYKKTDPLFHTGWLYSSIINAFLFKLCEKYQNVFAMASDLGLGASMSRSNAKYLQNNLEILMNKNIILLPANLTGDHWIILAVHINEHEVRYYDPMVAPLSKRAIALLSQVVADMKKTFPSPSQWKIKVVQNPKQDDTVNCGPFICYFAAQTANSSALSQPPENMRKFIFDTIVGKCLRRSNHLLEQCGKCKALYDDDGLPAELLWVCCSQCEQWYHKSCVNHTDDIFTC